MKMMKAVLADGPGGPEVLRLAEVARPQAGPGEIVVSVKACALNPVDYKIRAGYLSARRTYPAIYGYDVSGVVDETGAGVSEFAPGDEVFYCAELFGQGAYAQFHAVRTDIVHKKPANLTHVQAAAIPLAGMAAWQGLFKQARLAMGETILIYGAAGGVGSLAVQMASWAGARVIGVCSTANFEYLKSLGADHIVDYTKGSVAERIHQITNGEGVEVVLETVGDDCLIESFEIIKQFGRIVFLNAITSNKPLSALNPAKLKNAAIFCELERPAKETLSAIYTLVTRGFIKPQVDQVISLGQVAEGHRRLEGRHGRGKIVIDLSI
ncbi:MAG: zinc-binding dehydrogenase [Nitrospinae bacterium]|nr:zinc-binding dehydrogenase [Nitrospinota bacterium]